MDMPENTCDWEQMSTEKKRFSISELCRLCGNSSDNLLPIHEGEGLENDLGKKIEKHLPVRLLENDSFPQHVCYNCGNTLLAWDEIAENILKVEEKFSSILENISHTKQVKCENGSKAVHLKTPYSSRDGRKTYSAKLPDDENILPVTERSQEQEIESVSQYKPDGEILSASFTLFEHSAMKLALNYVEDGVTFSRPLVSGNLNNNSKKKGFTLVNKESNSLCYTYENPEQSAQTINSQSPDFCGSVVLTKDATTPRSIDIELCTFAENVCSTFKSQIKHGRDHDYVRPGGNSLETVKQIETSLFYSKSIDSIALEQSEPSKDAQLPYWCNYILKIIRSTEKTRVIVQWLPRKVKRVLKCEQCTCSFQSLSVLLTHSRFHSKRTPFYCKFCGRKFFLYGSLKQHHKHCTNERGQIDICGVPHAVNQEAKVPFVCEICGKKYATKTSLKDHLTEHIGKVSFVCGICGKDCKTKASLSEHLSNHLGEVPPYVCGICSKEYKLRTSLKDHLMQHVGKAKLKLKCEKCGAKFLRKAQVLEHMKTHNNEVLACELCDKIVLNKRDLKYHLISHSSQRPFSCNECGVSYKRKSHLNRHYRTHTCPSKHSRSDKNCELTFQDLRCDVCNKIFRSKQLLKIHKITHTGERKHECPVCSKRFGQSGALTRHIHTVHGGAKDFVCDVCNCCFTAKATMENHKRIHTGERPFQCTQCGKTFRTQQQQKMHEKVHSEERPFECRYCSKQFRRRQHLVVHSRTHTGEKPFKCPSCGRGFSQKNDMLKHLRIHGRSY